MTSVPELVAVDPFDLPDWLGEQDVTWSSVSGLHSGPAVVGVLTGEGRPDHPCDLLAVDAAYPAPVAGDDVRLACHQAWQHGEVHLVRAEGRLTLGVPGSAFTADLAMEAVGRLARAVGAAAARYAVRLRIGD